MTQQKTTSKFDVSDIGMRQLHEGRPKWQLIKELIANSWDEKTVTKVKVELSSYYDGKKWTVKVTDNGAGFRDIADAYTLMAPTQKRTDSEVRGRFNIGEKEIISIAESTTVETVGQTVEFPKSGGRKVTKNNIKKGTTIECVLDVESLSEDREEFGKQMMDAYKRLSTFITPKNISTEIVINSPIGQNDFSVKLEDRNLIKSFPVGSLKTVIGMGKNNALRESWRSTTINVYETSNAVEKETEKQGSLFEMGIYIQDIDCPFDVDVMQKVPLAQNRDMVPDFYLQDIFAHILNNVAETITERDASDHWIKLAMNDKIVTPETVQIIRLKRFGEKTVIANPFDPQANEKAWSQGYDVISPKNLSQTERELFRSVGMATSSEKFGDKVTFGIPTPVKVTESMREFSYIVRWIGTSLGREDFRINFEYNSGSFLAGWSTSAREMTFNISAHSRKRLPKKWFETKNFELNEKQLGIVLHELSHDNDDDRSHTGKFLDMTTSLGSRLFTDRENILSKKEEWIKKCSDEK